MAHRSLQIFLAGLLGLSSLAASAEESRYGREAVADIRDRIGMQECDRAVAELKTGLKKGFPEVALLAGSMYENGVCVARDWNRAVVFYVQALEGGMQEGGDRLAAGYATPENGADVAAALWWSRQGSDLGARIKGMPDCRVSAAAAGDIDRFVAELQTWPQERLTLCNYLIGVVSTISAELAYPAMASTYGVGADVNLRFAPALPKIDLQRGEVREYRLYGMVDGDQARERGSRSAGGFDKAMREVSDRALRRYPQPKGIPADMLLTLTWHFGIQME